MNIIEFKLEENEFIIKFFEDDSGKYRSWMFPNIILKEIINWFSKNKNKLIIEETELCKFNLKLNQLYIKRKDIYTTIGYSLPIEVLDYLVKNKKIWVQNK